MKQKNKCPKTTGKAHNNRVHVGGPCVCKSTFATTKTKTTPGIKIPCHILICVATTRKWSQTIYVSLYGIYVGPYQNMRHRGGWQRKKPKGKETTQGPNQEPLPVSIGTRLRHTKKSSHNVLLGHPGIFAAQYKTFWARKNKVEKQVIYSLHIVQCGTQLICAKRQTLFSRALQSSATGPYRRRVHGPRTR